MGLIYMIENMINAKKYVGQTVFTLQKRWNEHKKDASSEKNCKYPIHKAIKKYGVDNFKISVLEDDVDNNELNTREQYWISRLDTYILNGNGYNCTLGGEGTREIDYEEVYKLWDQGLSIADIYTKLNRDRGVIRQIIQTLDSYSEEEARRRGALDKKYVTANDGQPTYLNNRKIYNHHTVLQFDKYGNFIREYANAVEASEQTNIFPQTIIKSLNHKLKHAGGFQWRYSDDKDTPNDISDFFIKRTVLQIDPLTGEILNEYKNPSAASKMNNVCASSIRNGCQDENRLINGYKWRYRYTKME